MHTSGIISTIIGSATSAGFSGDGGLASNAQIDLPTSVFSDISGNIYFTDQYNQRVRRINTSGISNNDKEILIFPNPSRGKIFIAKNENNISLKIYNSLGEKINFKIQNDEIDLSIQPAGIYFVEIIADGKRTVKKIILE